MLRTFRRFASFLQFLAILQIFAILPGKCFSTPMISYEKLLSVLVAGSVCYSPSVDGTAPEIKRMKFILFSLISQLLPKCKFTFCSRHQRGVVITRRCSAHGNRIGTIRPAYPDINPRIGNRARRRLHKAIVHIKEPGNVRHMPPAGQEIKERQRGHALRKPVTAFVRPHPHARRRGRIQPRIVRYGALQRGLLLNRHTPQGKQTAPQVVT